MDTDRFVILAADLDKDSWGIVSKTVGEALEAHPKGFIPLATAIWLVDRIQAEAELLALTGQLRRHDVPYALVPLSQRPTIHATGKTIAEVLSSDCDAYTISCPTRPGEGK